MKGKMKDKRRKRRNASMRCRKEIVLGVIIYISYMIEGGNSVGHGCAN
jgi:hypothetical protein